MENLSCYETLLEAVKDYPHGLAVYYQGKKLSYKKFDKLINRMSDILMNRLDIQKGDVLLIAQPNIPEVLILFYAANKIGAVCNFVHPFTPFNQIVSIIEQTNSKYAFLFEQRVAKEVERYREIADKVIVTRIEDFLPLGKKFIYHNFMNKAIRKKLGKWRGSFPGFKYLKDLKPAHKNPEIVRNNGANTSILLHSGSTTGQPKTICLCDNNMNFVASHACEMLACTPEYIRGGGMLSVLPSFHGFGLCITMHAPLITRFATILMPKFSAKETAKLMRKTKVSCICGVPTMYENLLKCDEFIHNKYLKRLHVVFCGGDSLPRKLQEDFNKVMKENGSTCQMFEGYGLTEGVCVNIVNTFAHNKPGSIGYPISGAEFKIVDENGKELPRGEIGEICLKSPAVMNGYYHDEAATKEALRDGWLYTGDLGYMDEDNFIFFKQRKKRVVKVSGVGVFPTEIERLVESVPGVEACCAIQIPDPRLQNAIKVFVVAKFFDEVGMRNDIMDTCRKYLIRWAVPKEIEFVSSLPKTLLGKIDFKVLQQQENERRGIK
ncbi:MAG: acyl--CoA ligase [Bacilli bacterium]|nr:acyl--CoA ligase [Bacilli bacterium]